MTAPTMSFRVDRLAGFCLVMAVAGHVAAGQVQAHRWAGPVELIEWKRVGHAPGSTPRDARGVVITIDPNDTPHTFRSPVLDIPAGEVQGVRITYTADYGPLRSPVFIVGALDSLRDIENVRGCEIVAPVQAKGTHTAVVNLRASPCWQSQAIIRHIDINVDGSRSGVRPAVVRIHSIELTRP